MKTKLEILKWILVATALFGCEEREETPAGFDEDTASDFENFEVEWVEDAIILDDPTAIQDALVSMDYETGELVLSPSFEGFDQLKPEKVALIGGIGIFNIVGRETVDEGEKLILEPATLTDVIENGIIEWRRDFLAAPFSEKLGLGIDENESDTIKQMSYPLSGSYEGDTLKFEGDISGFATTFTLEKADDAYAMKLKAERSGTDAIAANVVIEGEIQGLTNETHIEIQGRSVTDFTMRIENLKGELNLAAGAVELGKGEATLAVPARISVPIVLGGIPFRIDLGGSLEIQSSITNQTSAILHATTAFEGACGFAYNGKGFRVINEIKSTKVERGEVQHMGAVTSGLGVLLNFPEVGIGVGVPKLTEGRVFVRLKSEILSNMSYYYDIVGPTIVPDGACVETGVNFGVYYGGSLSFAGLADFETEQPIYTFIGENSYMGDACDQ